MTRAIATIALFALLGGSASPTRLPGVEQLAASHLRALGHTRARVAAADTSRAGADETEITRIAQALLDGVARGDTALWNRYLDEQFVMTDEEGHVITKRELLAQLRPLPPGFSGSIEVTDAKVRFHGDAAVLTHLDLEHETVFGQTINARYRTTDTYVRRDGGWKLAASQVMVIPEPRHAVTVDPEVLSAFVGDYELAPSVVYTITREGDRLYGQRGSGPRVELLPASESSVFPAGTWRLEKIFVRDSAGRVVQMIDRRDNRDLVWRKVR